MNGKWILFGMTVLIVSGCGEKDDATKGGKSEASENYVTSDPEIKYAASTNGPAPAPLTNSPFAAASSAGMEQTTGIPTADSDGNQLNQLQGLQRAVDYYTRVMVPQSGPRGPGDKRQRLPELTDLQQLVKYGVIKQVPAAPAGKKYAVQGGLVKVVDQ